MEVEVPKVTPPMIDLTEEEETKDVNPFTESAGNNTAKRMSPRQFRTLSSSDLRVLECNQLLDILAKQNRVSPSGW